MDLADPYTGGEHRYLVPKQETDKPPIRQLFLWRADGKQAPRIGWSLSPDLNEVEAGMGCFWNGTFLATAPRLNEVNRELVRWITALGLFVFCRECEV
ncbi:hypothetical protein V8F20_010410 [Naviculisporaceae sp. PSN 640]